MLFSILREQHRFSGTVTFLAVALPSSEQELMVITTLIRLDLGRLDIHGLGNSIRGKRR